MTRTRAWLPRLSGILAAAAAAILSLPVAAAHAAPLAGQQRAVMILLDTNSSIYGHSWTAERNAAVRYIDALPAGVRAGLITFSNKWHLVLAPTSNLARLTAAVTAAPTGGPTSDGLRGALVAAATALTSAGAADHGRLLVLSDGEILTGRPEAGRIPVDVVTWYVEVDDHLTAVKRLASLTGGRVAAPAHAAGLAAIMAGPPPKPAVTPSPQRRPSARATRPAPRALSGLGLVAGVFAVLFLLALMAIGALRPGDHGRRRLAQLERYGPRHVPAPGEPASDGKAVSAALDVAARLLRSSNAEPRLAARLDMAGITRRPAEWAVLGTAATVVLVAALTVVTRNVLLAVPIGGIAGWLTMRLLLSIRISRRRAAFADQLPDMLQLVAGSLQAGFSLAQALDAVAREDAQPASGEVSRALAEVRIGAELEATLGAVAERMDSDDMRWTVMAIHIQREVGGNLAEVLRNTVVTIRERAYLRRQVRSLSGEGRLSAYILVGLPIAVGAWLFYSSPTYMRPLYTKPVGLLMLGGAGLLFVLGAFWMRALIKVEV
ncbi:MAG TPA: type II secretion system F family protein [Streptosporangiaceae bacterium]